MIKVFFQIVFREILIFFKILTSKLIDLVVMLSTNIIVFTFLMNNVGSYNNYGAFILVGLIPMIGFFEVIPKTTNLVMDINTTRKLSYFLTLPLPSILSIAAIPVGWAFCNMIFTVFMLPIAKIIMGSKLDLSHFSWFKFILIFTSINLFLGFFALWLGSLIKDMKCISWIWTRIVSPLFMLGGYFYSWEVIFKNIKWLGILNLANPMIYTTEGIRAAVLGQDGFISFWYSLIAIWFFAFIFGFHGILKLKKRLDCV